MKIGILIKKFDTLSNYELRIIQEIINNPKLELSLLILDGRVGTNNYQILKSKLYYLFISKYVLGKFIFTLQLLLEKIVFSNSFTADKQSIIQYLNQIDSITVKPERRGFIDIFKQQDVNGIRKYKLDIILQHEFNIIKGEILTVPKYGIWSFNHTFDSTNNYDPVGFWEIILQKPAVSVTLQQLTHKTNEILIIDKAFFNRHWSYFKTRELFLEASVSLLFKNIRKLQHSKNTITNLIHYSPTVYGEPSLSYVIKYIFHFYYNLIKRVTEEFNSKFFGFRYNCWTIFIGKGYFLSSTLSKLNPVQLPENEFWADPFIINYQGIDYVFFENYNYKLKKGKISCGKIKGNSICDIKDVLDLDYHLSYPYIFEEHDEIYLMPETRENNRLEIYKCINFPNKWKLYSTCFEGDSVSDPLFYDDEQNQKWLFINKKSDLHSPIDCELYIYRVDSLKLKHIEPHLQNPVIIDSRTARNGGAIFKHNNEFYRPSQASVDGIYGKGLNINRIEKLTIDEYNETKITTILPNFNKGLIAMHHLHQKDDLFVIDAAFKKK